MKLALEALENNRQTHYYCEDTWYSCPKHEEGCANESEGDECNCGADKANVEIDGAIVALREALANEALDKKAENARELGLDYEPARDSGIATAGGADPRTQRTWVGLSDLNIDELENNYMKSAQTAHEFLRAIEAKLKEKNT